MKLHYYECGIRQLRKYNEELCGDSIVVSRQTDSLTVALSDGLGSGVKANILATLTTQIAIHMLENGLPLDEVVWTLSETLPVDTIRKLAYSTFLLAQFFYYVGGARVIEFDTPSMILLRSRKVQPVVYEERSIQGKTIHETALDLRDGDWVVFVSDGVLNAGIGGAYPLGWGWEHVVSFLEKHAHHDLSAEDLADKLAETVNDLYVGNPGDDVSIAVIKVRQKLVATILTGPPLNGRLDEEIVTKFFRNTGKLAVCGGTTAKIVARHLGQEVQVDLTTMTPDVPPVGRLDGVDLVSEGILTLTKTVRLLQAGADRKTIRFQADGASNLLRLLLSVDHVHFIVGQAINPAHQNPGLPHHLDIRMAVVRDIMDELRKRGKEVTVETV